MTLRWKQFERRAKKLARAELRTSPKLKAQRNKAQKVRRTSNQTVLLHFLLLIFGIGPMITWGQVSPDLALPALAVSITGLSCLNAFGWLNRLYNGADLAAFSLLPLTAADIFRVQSRRSLLGMTMVVFSFSLLYLFALEKDFSPKFAPACILGVAQTLLGFALAAHLLAYVPSGIFSIVGVAFTVGWTILSPMFVAASPVKAAEGWTILALFLPASWIHQLYMALAGKSSWHYMLFGLPVVATFAFAPYSFRRIRRSYILALDHFEPASGAPDQSNDAPATGPTELVEQILAGQTLAPPALVPTGFIERLVLLSLTDRERLLAAFIWRRAMWTRSWRWCLGILVVISVIVTIFGKAHVNPLSAYVFGFAFTVAPLFGSGPGLRGWPCGGGITASQFAFVPIGYDEMFRVAIKTGLIRFLATAPLWIVYTAYVSLTFGQSAMIGLGFAIKILLLIVAVQPCVFPISIASSHTIAKKVWAIPLILLFVCLFLAAVLFLIGIPTRTLDFVNTLPASAIALAAVFVTAFLWNRYYRWLYRTNRIDSLARRPR